MGGGASNLRSDMEELISCTYLLGRTLASMSFPDMYRLQDFHSPSAPALKSELAREALSADLDRSMRETRAALAAARAEDEAGLGGADGESEEDGDGDGDDDDDAPTIFPSGQTPSP